MNGYAVTAMLMINGAKWDYVIIVGADGQASSFAAVMNFLRGVFVPKVFTDYAAQCGDAREVEFFGVGL